MQSLMFLIFVIYGLIIINVCAVTILSDDQEIIKPEDDKIWFRWYQSYLGIVLSFALLYVYLYSHFFRMDCFYEVAEEMMKPGDG